MREPASFFGHRTEGSEIKGRIVSKYFDAWANVIARAAKGGDGRIAYVDLYAGPGRYDEGAASTPLLVLDKAIARPDLHSRLVAIFNDADFAHHRRLQQEISALPGIGKLHYRPVVLNLEVGPELAATLGKTRLVPTFSFVDPCGYKGLSLDIIRYLIRDWGCDSLFFFNYRRINAALENDLFKGHVDGLFGIRRAGAIREKLPALRPRQREEFIHSELALALGEAGGRFVLPFTFKNPNGTRITHSLIFVSKDPKGFEIMKEIMAPESSTSVQGVPSFDYSPADERISRLPFDRPLDELQDMLMREFSGKTIRAGDLHKNHQGRGRFIKRNYKDALLGLEHAGKIRAVPGKRPLNTFGDAVTITFLGQAT